MKIWMVAYSARGAALAGRLAQSAALKAHEIRRFAPEKYCTDAGTEPLASDAAQWAGEGFAQADALVFVCAAGIAVRAIARHVSSKKTDPAVVVVDECGSYAVPILSGHLGGANELACEIAAAAGAQPVITTATDRNGVFAVDVFARKNKLWIENMTLAREVSAALLAGEPVGFCSELPVEGEIPRELGGAGAQLGVCVSGDLACRPFAKTLHLVPRRFAAGLGCKKGKDAAVIERFFTEQLVQNGVSVHELACIASIDLKKDEPGLVALAERYEVPFRTYSAAELNAVEGEFSSSGFVQETVGVDCVCERAACLAGGSLVCRKTAAEGMTFALAKNEEGVHFG